MASSLERKEKGGSDNSGGDNNGMDKSGDKVTENRYQERNLILLYQLNDLNKIHIELESI